jgi:hypothetical protein
MLEILVEIHAGRGFAKQVKAVIPLIRNRICCVRSIRGESARGTPEINDMNAKALTWYSIRRITINPFTPGLILGIIARLRDRQREEWSGGCRAFVSHVSQPAFGVSLSGQATGWQKCIVHHCRWLHRDVSRLFTLLAWVGNRD